MINDRGSYTNSPFVTLTISATDATSEVSQMRFNSDNTTWTSWEPFSTSRFWILSALDGTRTVHVQLENGAGLNSEYQDTIILDATRPTANAGASRTVKEDAEVTFDASSSTDENGIRSYTWTFTDSTLNGRNVSYV